MIFDSYYIKTVLQSVFRELSILILQERKLIILKEKEC